MKSPELSSAKPIRHEPTPPIRLRYLDDLRAFLSILVVMHHAGLPYGPNGGNWPLSHTEKFNLLGPFFHINASFFMGLFFLIAGYFVPTAYEKKGPKQFMLDRLQKFGLPILIFGLVFIPVVRHFLKGLPWENCFFPFEFAHLWFLGHLLIYSAAYIAFRKFTRGNGFIAASSFPKSRTILIYAMSLAIVSTLIRIKFPIDVWVRWFVPAEIAHLPQYLSLFTIGIVAGTHNWLNKIPDSTGRGWLLVALLMVIARYAYSLAHLWQFDHDQWWIPYLWNQWEALLCVGMCIGLIYGFRHLPFASGPLAAFAGRHAFLVYVIHLPILVAIQMAMENTALGPLTLTLVTGILTLLVCYLLAWITTCLRARLVRVAPFRILAEIAQNKG